MFEWIMNRAAGADKGGIWQLITGKHFTESVADFFLYSADILIGVGVFCTFFAMGGSKKAVKGIYWSLFTYLFIQIVGTMYT